MPDIQTEIQPRKRPPMSAEQRATKGRTFSYIAEEIGVCRDVIGRELRAFSISTAPARAERRARRGRGFWRCFDE